MAEVVLDNPGEDIQLPFEGLQITNEEVFEWNNWRFKTPPHENIKKIQIDPERITELNTLPIAERIVNTAYYTLELSNPKLKSMREISRLAEILGEIGHGEPETPVRDKIVDNFLLADAVNRSLWDAYEIYSSLPPKDEKHLRDITKGFDPETVGSLAVLRRMTVVSNETKRVPKHIARSVDGVLRVVLSNEVDIPVPQSTHLEPV